eukprot:7231539-Prymnesium_polylepis.1
MSDVCILRAAFSEAEVSNEDVVGWRAEVMEVQTNKMNVSIRVFDACWFRLLRLTTCARSSDNQDRSRLQSPPMMTRQMIRRLSH